MITFLTGVPGSGKTYKAVVSIYNNFSKSENAKPDIKKDYENCYTNINELKYEELHDTYSLDLDELLIKLTSLHALYKAKATDEKLIDKCKELEIYRSLFVIDEAHNIFDTENRILIWWLSYHRHLYHDVFLITQNLSLVKSKYKAFSEYFYRAKSTTVSLNRNTFKYDVYINSRMSMNSRSHTEKIAKNEEVFNLYHSGDSVSTKNVLLKFYIFSAVAVLFMFAIGYYLFGGSSDDNVIEQQEKNVTQQVQIIEDEKLLLNGDEFRENTYLKLSCSKTKCNDEVISIPPQLLRIFIDNNSMIVLYAETVNQNLTIYHIDTKTEFYNYIKPKKGNNNENFNTSDDSNPLELIGMGE